MEERRRSARLSQLASQPTPEKNVKETSLIAITEIGRKKRGRPAKFGPNLEKYVREKQAAIESMKRALVSATRTGEGAKKPRGAELEVEAMSSTMRSIVDEIINDPALRERKEYVFEPKPSAAAAAAAAPPAPARHDILLSIEPSLYAAQDDVEDPSMKSVASVLGARVKSYTPRLKHLAKLSPEPQPVTVSTTITATGSLNIPQSALAAVLAPGEPQTSQPMDEYEAYEARTEDEVPSDSNNPLEAFGGNIQLADATEIGDTMHQTARSLRQMNDLTRMLEDNGFRAERLKKATELSRSADDMDLLARHGRFWQKKTDAAQRLSMGLDTERREPITQATPVVDAPHVCLMVDYLKACMQKMGDQLTLQYDVLRKYKEEAAAHIDMLQARERALNDYSWRERLSQEDRAKMPPVDMAGCGMAPDSTHIAYMGAVTSVKADQSAMLRTCLRAVFPNHSDQDLSALFFETYTVNRYHR